MNTYQFVINVPGKYENFSKLGDVKLNDVGLRLNSETINDKEQNNTRKNITINQLNYKDSIVKYNIPPSIGDTWSFVECIINLDVKHGINFDGIIFDKKYYDTYDFLFSKWGVHQVIRIVCILLRSDVVLYSRIYVINKELKMLILNVSDDIFDKTDIYDAEYNIPNGPILFFKKNDKNNTIHTNLLCYTKRILAYL